MSIEASALTAEQRVKNILKKVLDIDPSEVKSDAKLDQSLGIDSTEMVEISVGVKKEFNVPIADNEIKKTFSVNDILNVLKTKGIK
ncbi:MAG: phosphopantetheine-binding protein [Candidatus Omnitrophota bacterium]